MINFIKFIYNGMLDIFVSLIFFFNFSIFFENRLFFFKINFSCKG